MDRKKEEKNSTADSFFSARNKPLRAADIIYCEYFLFRIIHNRITVFMFRSDSLFGREARL